MTPAIIVAVLFMQVAFGFFSSMIAISKGRSRSGWFVVGFLFGPFGMLAAGLMETQQTQDEQQEYLRVKNKQDQSRKERSTERLADELIKEK